MSEPDHVGAHADDLIVISDFHMAAGDDTLSSTFGHGEEYSYDAVFGRFVDSLIARAAREGRRWRLLILGDLLDFAKIRLRRSDGLGTEPETPEEVAIAKLERIADYHPAVFAALGTFASAGFPIDIVPGNHDIDLTRVSVQERFRELVAQSGCRLETAAGIRFHPWIIHIPGVLYAEHGHQHHDINWFATLLRPHAPQPSEEIDQPLASFLDRYLLDLVDSIDPLADIAQPLMVRIRAAFIKRPWLAIATLAHLGRLIRVIVGQIVDRSSTRLATRRAVYQTDVLRPYAAAVDLTAETLVAIDNLAATTARSVGPRLLRRWIWAPLSRSLPGVVGLLITCAILRRLVPFGRSLPICLLAVLALYQVGRTGRDAAVRSSAYLHRSALAIDRLLRAENAGVRFLVFGHTHVAEQVPLTCSDPASSYLNAGSWSASAVRESAVRCGRQQFPFIEVVHDRESATPVARVMIWNDATGRHEPLTRSGR